jgi:tetratricopeptide (TPR) repeat protein
MSVIKNHWKAILVTLTGVIVAALVADGIYEGLKPSMADRLAQEAVMAFQNGDTDQAQEKIYKAAQLCSRTLAVQRAQARIWAEEYPATVVEFWDGALKLSKGAAEDRRGLISALLQAGNVERAQKEFEVLQSQMPNDPSTQLEGISLLAANGRPDEALQKTIELVTRYPSHQEFWVAYGQLVETLDDPVVNKRFLQDIESLKTDRGPLGLWALAKASRLCEDADFARNWDAMMAHPMMTRQIQLDGILLARDRMHFSDASVRDQAQRLFNLVDPEDCKAFFAFLSSWGDYEGVLSVLVPKMAVADRAFMIYYIKALLGEHKWLQVQEILTNVRTPLMPWQRNLFMAEALAGSGRQSEADENWAQTVNLIGPQKYYLETVLDEMRNLKAWDQVEATYPKLLAITPQALQHAVYQKWVAFEVERKDLDGLMRVLEKMQTEFPEDLFVKDSLLYYRTLKGAPGNWVAEAYKNAQEFSNTSACRVTLALALLKTHQAGKAMEVIESLRFSNWRRVDVTWQFVRAAVLKANGRAFPDLTARVGDVLPEEAALLYPTGAQK